MQKKAETRTKEQYCLPASSNLETDIGYHSQKKGSMVKSVKRIEALQKPLKI